MSRELNTSSTAVILCLFIPIRYDMIGRREVAAADMLIELFFNYGQFAVTKSEQRFRLNLKQANEYRLPRSHSRTSPKKDPTVFTRTRARVCVCDILAPVAGVVR
jgi:hypothetical protein